MVWAGLTDGVTLRGSGSFVRLTPSPRAFCFVEQMALKVAAVDRERRQGAVMAALFRAPEVCYAHLHSLHVHIDVDDGEDRVHLPVESSFFEPLLSLPSLHTLNLSADFSMDWSAFRLLLTLPLTHCDLSWVDVTIPVTAQQFSDGDGSSDATRRPSAATHKVLKLPYIYTSSSNRAEIMDVILQYAEEQHGTRRDALEHISVRTLNTQHEIACLVRLSHLRALEVHS